MKKLIIGFLIGVALTVPVMMGITQPGIPAEEPAPTPEIVYVTPTPMPTPTPQVIYKERLTDLEQVVANTKDSCVMIYAYRSDGSGEQGSGWAYNGHVITAKHVVEGAKQIDIFTDDYKYAVGGGIEYIDDALDVAVLRVAKTLPSVTLGDSDALKEGEKLVSITSPEGAQNAIDECVNSGVVHTDDGSYLIVSESDMRSGSSGGAVFNYNSEIIGMVVRGSGGEHFLLPITQLKPILNKIK